MQLATHFFCDSTLKVAKALLGKRLVRRLPEGEASGLIVEVEAYLWRGDPACHANRGMTPSNRAMFGPPGTLYVYPIHAKYCMNVVTEREGRGAAVLIRALQPIDGIDILQKYRTGVELRQLMNGPGKVCMAMNIDRRLNGIDLSKHDQIWLEEDTTSQSRRFAIQATGRIGISAAKDKRWRFFVDGNRFVSGRLSDHSQKGISQSRNGRMEKDAPSTYRRAFE